ncbi:MAG: NERD domain-containing protein [Angelakisella sp.]
MDALKELLLFIGDWLLANPPWLIGLVAVLAVALWYLLHIRPEAKREEQLRQHMVLNHADEQATESKNETERLKMDAIILRKQIKWEQANAVRLEKELAELKEKETQRRASAEQSRRDREEKEVVQAALDEAARKEAGTAFEMRIKEMLKTKLVEWFDQGDAKLLYNVTLPKSGTQIDLILIHRSGIYIIECKCWDGFFLGRYDWQKVFKVQCHKNSSGLPAFIAPGKLTVEFLDNPIYQNSYHQKEMAKCLRGFDCIHTDMYKQLSVFDNCGNADFILPKKIASPELQLKNIWHGNKDELIDKIRAYDRTLSAKIPRLTAKNMLELQEKLQPSA